MKSIHYYGLLSALSLGTLTAATTTAYVPVCCNAKSTVSMINTAQNRVITSFAAGQTSYGVTLVNPTTAWVTNATDRSISVVSLVTGRIKMTIPLQIQPWLIQTSPDGARVYVVTGMFTGNLDHYTSRLLAFDAQTGAAAGSVALPNDGLSNPGLVVSSDSTRVYATFDSKTVTVFDVASGTTAATWQTTSSSTWTASGTLTLSPDGHTLYTSGIVLTAIDTATGNVKGTVNPPGLSQFFSFVGSAVTHDGSTLYATYGSQIGTGSGIAVIDTASLTVTNSSALGSELQQPVLSKNETTLYAPDAIDSLMYVVNTGSLAATSSIALPGVIASATLSPDGSTLLVPNSSTASALTFDTSTLNMTGAISISGTNNTQPVLHGPTNASASSDGSRVFVAGIESNSISQINTATNKVAKTFTDGALSPSVTGDNPPAIMTTPNGRQVYLAGSDYQTELTVIDTSTGEVKGVPCLIPTGCLVESMAAQPDSSRVYVTVVGFVFDGNPPQFFYVIDPAALRVITKVKIRSVGALAVSPDGKFVYLAAGSNISIFDTTQNAFTSTLPFSGVTAMAFSPDGTTLYAAVAGKVELIDVASGQVTASANLGSGTVNSISVTPDGTQAWIAMDTSTSVFVMDTQTTDVQELQLGLQVSGVAFAVR